jgi:hypothetical protein
LILTSGGTPSAQAAKNATATIPIVFATGGDAVGDGLVANLARPGGNVTGVSFLTAELDPKRIGLMSELVPQARVIALLVNPDNPQSERIVTYVQKAARAKDVQLPVLKASGAGEITLHSRHSLPFAPMRWSSAAIRSFSVGATRSWRWPHATPYPRSISFANSSMPAASLATVRASRPCIARPAFTPDRSSRA